MILECNLAVFISQISGNRYRSCIKFRIKIGISDANAQVERLVSTDHITQVAQQHALDIVQQAKREANALRGGTQDYVSKSLGQTATLLNDLLRRTEAGMKALADRGEVDEPANIDLD